MATLEKIDFPKVGGFQQFISISFHVYFPQGVALHMHPSLPHMNWH